MQTSSPPPQTEITTEDQALIGARTPDLGSPAAGTGPRRRRALAAYIAVSAVAGAACGTAALLALARMDDSEARASAVLRPTQAALVETARGLEDADKIDELNRVGATAQRRSAQTLALLESAASISEDPVREATRAALASAIGILDAAADLEGLTPQSLAAWDDIERDLSGQADALMAARPQVDALALEEPVELTGGPVRAASASASDLVEDAESELRAWRRATREARRSRTRTLRRAQAYRDGVDPLLDQYAAARTSLAGWTAQLEADPYGTTFAEDYAQLADHKGRRDRLRMALAAFDPPTGVSAEHNRLITVIDTAIDAMDSAIDGEQQWQSCIGGIGCPQFNETASWRRFQERSAQISSEFPSARSAWRAAVQRVIDRLERDGGAPPMPEI